MTNPPLKWTRVTGALLMAGALAWAIKLAVIITTNGRIIDTGASAFLMKIGLIMLAVGSTGIGMRLSQNRNRFLKTVCFVLSPVIVFGSFLLFAQVTSPFFKSSSIWYAQQEAPIGLAVLVYISVGYYLYRCAARVKY